MFAEDGVASDYFYQSIGYWVVNNSLRSYIFCNIFYDYLCN